jgi:hypothetical protein
VIRESCLSSTIRRNIDGFVIYKANVDKYL